MTLLPMLFDNPIFLRELRRRMRGKAMIFFLIAYVGLVCGISFLLLTVQSARLDPRQGQNFVAQIAGVGRSVFFTVFGVQALLVLLVAPSITAGMITAERERQTFDFLRVTTIRPSTFVAGGLISTMMYVVLVQICALPVLCVPFLYGGMSPEEVLGWFGLLLGASLAMCSAGMYLSSIKDKTRSSQGAMMALTLGLFFLMFFGVIRASVIGGSGAFTGFLWTRAPLWGGALMVPGWALLMGAGAGVSALFLLIACRKLYDVEARSLRYGQFVGVFGVTLGFLMGKDWGAVGPDDAAVWLWAGLALLMAASMIFCASRVVVGDEQWRYKRLFPLLRVIDAPVYFVAALCGAWVWASWQYFHSGPSPVDGAAFQMGLAVTVTASMALAIIARILTLRFNNRLYVMRGLLAGVVLLWVVLPVALFVIANIGRGPADPAWLALTRISPLFAAAALVEAKASAGAAPLAWWLGMPGALSALLYLAVSVVAFLIYFPMSVRYVRSLRGLWAYDA